MPLTSANAALPLVLVLRESVCVRLSELVTVLAELALCAEHVLGRCHGLQMPDAGPDPANMIDEEVVCDRPRHSHVNDAVHEMRLVADADGAVTGGEPAASPQPAAAV